MMKTANTPRRGNTALTLVALGAFALTPALINRINPYDYNRSDFADQSVIEERNSNAFAVLMGEFRTNLSDLMFIKTERYLHQGVAYAPHLNMDRMAQTGEVVEKNDPGSGSAVRAEDLQPVEGKHWTEGGTDHGDHVHAPYDPDDHDDHDEGHAGVPTVIPDEYGDFRGWIGNMHRRVKPWQDPNAPHTHSDGEELLPWYRVMTLSNPQNVRAYLIGAWWLKTKRDPLYLAEAIKFADEGIANNPNAYQLYLMKGYTLRQLERDAEALDSFKRGAALIARNRPSNGTDNPRWTEYQEDDARAVARMAVFLEKEIGNPTEALRLAREYSAVLGGDGRLDANIAELQERILQEKLPVP